MMTLDEIKTVAEAVCAEKMPGAYVTFREGPSGMMLEVRKDEAGVPYGYGTALLGKEGPGEIAWRTESLIATLDHQSRIRALQPITPEKLEAWGNKVPLEEKNGTTYIKYKDERGEFWEGVSRPPQIAQAGT